MTEKLFDDKETFVKERPKKLPKVLEDNLYMEIAQEIIDENYSQSDLEDIADDIASLNLSENGYELAKKLENGNAYYDIDVDFCEYLDGLSMKKHRALNELVKQWVAAHDVKPKLESKIQIRFIKDNPHFKVGTELWIVSRINNEARYILNPDYKAEGGRLVPYEDVEAACEIIKTEKDD